MVNGVFITWLHAFPSTFLMIPARRSTVGWPFRIQVKSGADCTAESRHLGRRTRIQAIEKSAWGPPFRVLCFHICTDMHIYIHSYVYICIHTYTYIHMYVHIVVHICMYAHVCL